MENKLTTEKVVDVKDLHISFRTFKGYPHVLNEMCIRDSSDTGDGGTDSVGF